MFVCKGIFQEPYQKLLCEASPEEMKTMTHLLEIDNQLQNKIMSLLKTKFINQWVYRGCLQGHEWEVQYRSKDSSEAATSLKSTSTWLTIMETASLELTVCPAGNFVGLRASFRQFRQSFFPPPILFTPSIFWGEILLTLVVSGTSWDFWVVFFPSLTSVLPPSWKNVSIERKLL